MDLRKAWVRASVLLISREKISLPAMAVKGVSVPRACAIPVEDQRERTVRWQLALVRNGH